MNSAGSEIAWKYEGAVYPGENKPEPVVDGVKSTIEIIANEISQVWTKFFEQLEKLIFKPNVTLTECDPHSMWPSPYVTLTVCDPSLSQGQYECYIKDTEYSCSYTVQAPDLGAAVGSGGVTTFTVSLSLLSALILFYLH